MQEKDEGCLGIDALRESSISVSGSFGSLELSNQDVRKLKLALLILFVS